VLLLTGATGLVGRAVLRRLAASGTPVRCLVRDPRRLGPDRVRVQIALGDLADPQSFRNALRGVETVVHLAATIRDQPRGSIEELDGIATWRMVEAAGRSGVERFVFFSALGASAHDRTRLLRAKALAEQAVRDGPVASVIFAPSLVYAPGDAWLTLLSRLALLPVMPISGRGRAVYQPIWADDVARCVCAELATSGAPGTRRYELAGPETLSYEAIVRLALRSFDKRRPLLHVPIPLVAGGLRALEVLARSRAFATWDEAELMEVSMIAQAGTADAERLGVSPRSMPDVLGIPSARRSAGPAGLRRLSRLSG
jgi:NADH dehydrogenase